jgi:hypothetical protein
VALPDLRPPAGSPEPADAFPAPPRLPASGRHHNHVKETPVFATVTAPAASTARVEAAPGQLLLLDATEAPVLVALPQRAHPGVTVTVKVVAGTEPVTLQGVVDGVVEPTLQGVGQVARLAAVGPAAWVTV